MPFAIQFLHVTLFILTACMPVVSLSNNDCTAGNDTIFLPPDTVRNVIIDTVYEYEDETAPDIKHLTKKDRSTLVGGIAGVECNYFSQQYNTISPAAGLGFSSCFTYNQWFIDADLYISGIQSVSPQYTKHFTTKIAWTDTIKTLIDNYYQITNNDTIYTPIYKINYVSRSKNLESDTTYTSKNRYTSISLPITLGYCLKKRKTWIGFGGGAQFRYIIAWRNNKVAINESFASESSFFRPVSIGIVGKCFVKQKISRKWWLSIALLGSIPMYSQYNSTAGTLRIINWSATIGLQYFFRITYKDASETKHF